MKTAIAVLLLALVGFAAAENLGDFVTSAKEVSDLLAEGSDNCFLLLFVWKGEDKETQEAKDVQPIFEEYPECYAANFDVARDDTKELLNVLRFENDRDNFSKGREITPDDTPMLLAISNGKGYVASGPKPHKALKKELDALYREHEKTDIEYEGKAAEEEEKPADGGDEAAAL